MHSRCIKMKGVIKSSRSISLKQGKWNCWVRPTTLQIGKAHDPCCTSDPAQDVSVSDCTLGPLLTYYHLTTILLKLMSSTGVTRDRIYSKFMIYSLFEFLGRFTW